MNQISHIQSSSGFNSIDRIVKYRKQFYSVLFRLVKRKNLSQRHTLFFHFFVTATDAMNRKLGMLSLSPHGSENKLKYNVFNRLDHSQRASSIY